MNKRFTTEMKTSTMYLQEAGGDDHQTIGVPGKSIGLSDHLSKTTNLGRK